VVTVDIEEIFSLEPKQTLHVLSPHLDDALWSLGAVLAQVSAAGHPVHVITIFSETMQTAVRKMEDSEALASAGCAVTHLDFSDAILDGRRLADVFDETFTPAPHAVENIAKSVQELVPAGATVLAPSGFGVHVDHLAARAVATKLDAHVIYYEDLPYAARDVRLGDAQSFFAAHKLQRQSIAASENMIDEHIRLYNLYESQRQDHHVEQIRAYLAKAGFGVWL
jgi:LmbE family N-acetylglucosaminyl deacetylase